MRRIPLVAYFFLYTTDLTGGLKPLGSHGRISSLSEERDKPVYGHLLPGEGNRIQRGSIVDPHFAVSYDFVVIEPHSLGFDAIVSCNKSYLVYFFVGCCD